MKTVVKTYTIKVERDVPDDLGLSAAACQQIFDAAHAAFEQAMIEAMDKDRVLPRRVVATFKFAIEGPELP